MGIRSDKKNPLFEKKVIPEEKPEFPELEELEEYEESGERVRGVRSRKVHPLFTESGVQDVPVLKDEDKKVKVEERPEKYRPPVEVENWKIKQIIEHEGFRLNPYRDHLGNLTGGIGHKFTRDDYRNFDINWSDEEKLNYWMERFKEDYAFASRSAIAIMNKYNIKPNEAIQYVLTDMVFNMGPLGVGGGVGPKGKKVTGFKNFLTDLSKGNIEGAIMEMKRVSKNSAKPSKWYTQVPNRVEKLAEILRSVE